MQQPLSRYSSLPTHFQAPFQNVLHTFFRSGWQSLPHLVARLSFATAFLLLCWLLSGLLLQPPASHGTAKRFCGEPTRLGQALAALHQEYDTMEDGIARLQHQMHAINGSHDGWGELAQSMLHLPTHHSASAQWQTPHDVPHHEHDEYGVAAVVDDGGVQPHGNGMATNSSRPVTFLFVAVLTTSHNYDRRAAVRESWAAQPVAGTMVRFILYHNEKTPSVQEEADEHGDIVFVRDSVDMGYRSIVYKTFYSMEWAVEHVTARFILKTDDDTYVNLPLLLSELTARCRMPKCRNEALYVGQEARRTQVIVEKGHKWANLEYQSHLDLLEYFPYMYGGGYIVSADVATTLVQMEHTVGLKFMPNEDATFGFWVSGLNLRHVDHPKIKTTAGHCSFQFINAENSMARFVDASFREEEDVCAGWLLCHKIMTSREMRYMHYRVQACASDQALLHRAHQLAGALTLHLEQRTIPRHPHLVPTNTTHPSTNHTTTVEHARLALLRSTTTSVNLKPLTIYMLTNYSQGSHFYGDVPGGPWSACNRWLLAHRRASLLPDVVPVKLMPVEAEDVVDIVVVGLHGPPLTRKHTPWRSTLLGTSIAWNHHHGAFAQWMGVHNTTHVMFIDARCPVVPKKPLVPFRGLCTNIVTVPSGTWVAQLSIPLVAIHPMGALALSIDLCRLEAGAPGHGLNITHCRGGTPLAPMDPADGVWLVEVVTGHAELLVSYATLLQVVQEQQQGGRGDPVTGQAYGWGRMPRDVQTACLHWLGIPKFSADGHSLVFVYNIGHCIGGSKHWHASFVFTVDVQGRHLWRVPLIPTNAVLHGVDYGQHGQLVMCDAHEGQVYLATNRVNVTCMVKPHPFHKIHPHACRFLNTNPRFLLTDDDEGKKLLAWDLHKQDALFLGEFWDDHNWWDAAPGYGYIMPSMQPHFSHDGQYVVFQSGFYSTAAQQVFITNIQPLQATLAPLAAAATAAHGGIDSSSSALVMMHTHVFIDLAVRSGARVREFCLTTPNIHAYELHLFQTASLTPRQSQQLKQTLQLANVLAHNVVTHFAAASISDNVLNVHPHGCFTQRVSVKDLAEGVFDVRLKLPHVPLYQEKQHRGIQGWLMRLVHWKRRSAWWGDGGGAEGCVSGSGGMEQHVMVPAVNFGAWLQTTFDLDDHVVVVMDLGEGREVAMLEAMLHDGSLVNVDVLHVAWHHTLETFHRAMLFEQILGMLGVVVERLDS